jgi:FkbM family methyltransferase
MMTASAKLISYSQRFEDLYLMRCFGDRTEGFYIDIGAGHPVFDNVSFAFYLKGWSGITVEPNPALARLGRAVRPRDRMHEAVVGTRQGEATFYVVNEFHGFSTAIADNADAALTQFGKGSSAITVPATTLAALCAEHPPASIEFLKVDVEGSEADVLFSGDWERFRPKIIVVEALAPYTQLPAWDAWEPFLAERSYRYVWFDSLNRYYLADEARELAGYFETAPASFDAIRFRDAGRALEQPGHPHRPLAELLARAALVRAPVLDAAVLVDLVTAELPPELLAQAATAEAITAACGRLFGRPCSAAEIAALNLPAGTSVRDLYARLIDSDLFRTACGRISAGYAW